MKKPQDYILKNTTGTVNQNALDVKAIPDNLNEKEVGPDILFAIIAD